MSIHPKVVATSSTTVLAYAITTLVLNALHTNLPIASQQILVGLVASALGLLAGYLKSADPQFTSDNLVQHAQAVAAGVKAKNDQMKTAAAILDALEENSDG